MDELQGLAKKYWPWIVGGIIGIYLILRMGNSGGGNSAGTTSDPVAASAALEGARISSEAQTTMYMADVQKTLGLAKVAVEMQSAENSKVVSLYEIDQSAFLGMAGLQANTYMAELNTNAAIEQARINGMTTLGVAEIGAGVQSIFAYADVLHEMNVPTVAAINSVTTQNVAAIGALTTLGVESFRIRGDFAKLEAFTALEQQANYNMTVADIVKSTGMSGYLTTSVAAPAFYPAQIQNVERPNMDWLTDTVKAVGAFL